MKPREYVYWLALALFLVPGTVGQSPSGDELNEILFGAGNEGEIFRYQIGDITNTTIGDFDTNFTFFKLHTKTLGPTSPILRIGIETTYTILQSTDGSWHYQLSVNGTDIDDCEWILPTRNPGGFLDGDLVTYANFVTSCTVGPEITSGFQESQLVNLSVTRTVESGNPDEPTESITNIVVERADFVIVGDKPMDVTLTTLDFWIPILIFAGFMTWCLWNGWMFPALFGLIGATGQFYESFPIGTAGAVFLCLLSLWLQWWQKQRKEKTTKVI